MLHAIPLTLATHHSHCSRMLDGMAGKDEGSKKERVLLQPYNMNDTLPEQALLTPQGDVAKAVDSQFPPAV